MSGPGGGVGQAANLFPMSSEPTDRPRRPALPQGPALVVGLARSGQAAARLLAERGEEVIAVDSGSPAGAEGLRGLGVEVHLDGEGVELLERVTVLVKSPGVPQTAPVVEAARDAGNPVIGELELAWRALPNPFVAVTGTNGKTTVAEWLGHVWRTAGEPVEVAGNVGRPLSSLVGEIDESATVICECSSFQLEDATEFAPEVAVLLNVTPDHLDRHGTLAAYRESKLRVFANQGPSDVAIFDADQAGFAGSGRPGRGATVAYGISACAEGGCLVRLRRGSIEVDGEPLIAVEDLALAGEHNVRNAMAVAAAAISRGIDAVAVAEGLRTFPGVPHRLERVAEVGGVLYVNDSKATNVAAAEAAIRSFKGGVHVILGGSLKGGGFEALAPAVSEHCRAAYLIGPAAPLLRKALEGTGVELVDTGDLDYAVASASEAAAPGETVLLAPACASFDAFRDYAERGDRFRTLVEALR
jgi:UDP-N-acetylmuramoylalanine--D-glutamate ligase